MPLNKESKAVNWTVQVITSDNFSRVTSDDCHHDQE